MATIMIGVTTGVLALLVLALMYLRGQGQRKLLSVFSELKEADQRFDDQLGTLEEIVRRMRGERSRTPSRKAILAWEALVHADDDIVDYVLRDRRVRSSLVGAALAGHVYAMYCPHGSHVSPLGTFRIVRTRQYDPYSRLDADLRHMRPEDVWKIEDWFRPALAPIH